jgi:hypothetical protein
MNSNAMNKTFPPRVAWWDVIFGVWLLVSPFVLGFSRNTALTWNNVMVGALVAVLSLASRSEPVKGLLVLLGAWLFASVFVLGFVRLAPLWNNLVVAFLVIVGALFSEANDWRSRWPGSDDSGGGRRT